MISESKYVLLKVIYLFFEFSGIFTSSTITSFVKGLIIFAVTELIASQT